MTRGFHSRNATFSICNGALLYCKHLCQSGRDTLVEGELYKGTSKSAEGYAAHLYHGHQGFIIDNHTPPLGLGGYP